jgi:hypothetical protein
MIRSVDQALGILDDRSRPPVEREVAGRYLMAHPDAKAAARLVLALQDDAAGVVWSAAETLAQLGDAALVELCRALADHKRAGDPRLLNGAYQALYHMQNATRPDILGRLMRALKSPAPDLAAMEEAHQVLRELGQNGNDEQNGKRGRDVI